MGVHRFVLRYSAEVWAAEEESPGAVLRSAGEAIEERGGLFCLYWPSTDPFALLVAEGSDDLAASGPAIADRAGAVLERQDAVGLTGWIDSVGPARAAEIAMAMPAPKWRCRECGKTQPPHLDGCPYRIDSDTVRLLASVSAVIR